MIDKSNRILIAKNDAGPLHILPSMLTRHGLITGATGTGKTVSMQVIAESVSALGAPVLVVDVKGDVSGISKASGDNPKVGERVRLLQLGEDGYSPRGSPVCFWDIFGQQGHPLRATISEMGPMLLSRILDLNDTQTGAMRILFRIADDQGLLLLDLKDLRKLTEYVSRNRGEYVATHGNLAAATLGAIQRGLLNLEEQGAEVFFGEPALDIQDLLRRSLGMGMVNLLAADRLMGAPRTYAAFLLWLLSEIYEGLPEAGDLPLPRLVLFFDEAHLVFSGAPKALLEKIEQVVRLIRSKGVGVFFITQNPADIPESVLAQLGNRVQHALRAYTPGERKAVRAAADAFRPNPAFKTEEVITALGVGEALISCLGEKGVPAVVQRALVAPPESRIGPVSPDERRTAILASQLYGKYEQAVDRESAYEILTERVMRKTEEQERARPARKGGDEGVLGEVVGDFARKTRQSISRNLANQIGRSLIRGVLGGLFGGKK